MTAAHIPSTSPRVRQAKKRAPVAERLDCERKGGVCPVMDLRAALAREATLLRQRDALIEQQATLARESDHRLLNNLQMVSSLLSMQSRASVHAETASALAIAADRIAVIARIHRHLHPSDGVESVAFKRFLEELCSDFMAMLATKEAASRAIVVEGIELQLPAAVAIPLGFVASELITNALKYGDEGVSVRLEPDPRKGFALSVENGGDALPDHFSPTDSKGSGMRIIRSLVAAIGGELCISRGEEDGGARFIVLFSVPQ